VLASAFMLSGCQTASKLADQTAAAVSPYVTPLVTPYKIDVVQGNVLTREQLAALQLGMPRAQVPGVVGTSLLASVFHANRWDYVFSFKRKGGALESRRVTLWFEADKLARIEADELPSEAEFAVVTFKADASICLCISVTACEIVTLLRSVIALSAFVVVVANVIWTGVVAVPATRVLDILNMFAPAALKSK
jgi:outer membrane protein assembly factor BamE (lipoprotein component of BamABCDE complex)